MMRKQPGVFDKVATALARRRVMPDVSWLPTGRAYPRLIGFDAHELAGRSGLYLLWHLGVRPRWLRAAYSIDLGLAASSLAGVPELIDVERHDGPFLCWSFSPASDAAGLVSFLAQRLNPALQDVALACDLPIDRKAPAIECPLPAGTEDVQHALSDHAHRK